MKLGKTWLAYAKAAARTTLYTQDEFDLERGRQLRIYGYDPVPEAERRGWHDGEFHMMRWWWTPPWRRSSPTEWGYEVYKCGDEWCNDTIYIALPFPMGALTVRFRPGPIRTRDDGVCSDAWLAMGAPPCPLCLRLHMPHCLPVLLSCPVCRSDFPGYTSETFKDWVGVIGKDSYYYCSAKCAERGNRT